MNTEVELRIAKAVGLAQEMSPQDTDGTWLEDLAVQIGPYIREWDIDECWLWSKWPEREIHFPQTTNQDVGIDAVAVRRGVGEYVAIQCKARQLDEQGNGAPIEKGETDKFASASSSEFWAERWIVINGNSLLSNNAQQVLSMTSKPIKLVNITNDLLLQQGATADEECPHCAPNPDGEWRPRTRSCMQAEAVAESVRILEEHAKSDSGGLPVGQARGKIILPCGTGKTRISLRIVEQLTPPGELSIVLCPSIALVAQIRREYLQCADTRLRALAVCSDVTAGYDPSKEGSRDTASDPTLDNSNVSASVVKGKVTTDPAEIAKWIRDGQKVGRVNVIFGTYQSGRPIADALQETGVTARVLVADEAHRTAGLRRKKSAKPTVLSPDEQRVRDFTLCHDNDAMPATYRIYQTATPRVYDTTKVRLDHNSDWIVRSMDDEEVFGVELYRKSYVEAVNNGWLADYRIIAVALNDPGAYDVANELATITESKGRHRLTTTHFLRGLAFTLAMGGATVDAENGSVPIKSCIGFMNTVDKSKNLARDLQQPIVREWLQGWLDEHAEGQKAAHYSLEHLDATNNVSQRENAKRWLAAATATEPHGIINVGIFGEGTDSPSLSAVAFLESRKSPIDVIQAVGRAMRTAPDKSTGYIICPFVIPPNADAEAWLSNSSPEEGWQELGQILLALRAHDQRIEENLAGLLQLYLPKVPEKVHTFIGIAKGGDKRIQYWTHEGAPGDAQEAVEQVLKGAGPLPQGFVPLPPSMDFDLPAPDSIGVDAPGALWELTEERAPYGTHSPTTIITGKVNDDGSFDLRTDTVARERPDADGAPGALNIRKTKAKAKAMINKGDGNPLPMLDDKKKKRAKDDSKAIERQLRLLKEMQEFGEAIRMNLLEKSGLSDDRVLRDLNILEESVREAAHHLNADELRPALDRHFGLDNLKESELNKQADGCTIAALLMMNAAMLHQRIANGRWLSGISDLAVVKNDVNVVRRISREWNQIMYHDFRPVLEPAVKAVEAVEDTGKLAGLERALRHIAAEAERIAETYADMGADHAGPLFNRVMGNQASDGAYFTRPVAASIAARLTLDACEDVDWTDPSVWKEHKTIDLACGSGTLLAAVLTDMKRRAREGGADEARVTALQKLAVEETIGGLDINPVSLQLAASQLTAGNNNVSYRRMGLHQMPYGPDRDNPGRVAVGSLELLGQKAVVGRQGELDIADDIIASQSVWPPTFSHDAELEDAVSAVTDAGIVIMNPPFTNRANMGQKFPKETQERMRARADALERTLVGADPSLMDFTGKNSIGPLFVALADHVQRRPHGVVSMINPTIALSSTSGLKERQMLAERFQIHTVVTSHQPGNINMSQNTSINESIVVMCRHRNGSKPPTRFVHLDRMPVDESEVDDLHRCLLERTEGKLANGWGETSLWPAERMERGDWTPAIWRSPNLAEAAYAYADCEGMQSIEQEDIYQAGRRVSEFCEEASVNDEDCFALLHSKGADGQTKITAVPDRYYKPQDPNSEKCLQGVNNLKARAGHLLITDGQRTATARLTAVASDSRFVGVGWMPVTGFSPVESKAIAVFLNSTIGRIRIMSNASRTVEFPMYRPATYAKVRIPNIKDVRIRDVLANCWEHTKEMHVPQFRDGECEVRRLWDEAVAEAMGWDADELARLRNLLNDEPHVRGLGYNQYADEVDDMQPVDSPADVEEFQLVPNRSTLEPGMDDPKAMKQVLEEEDTERYLRAQADV